ncbi:MAG: type II secretion system F family protein [Planctomycetaceae bacterium]
MHTEVATKPLEIHAEFADIIRQETVRYESPSQSRLPRMINGKFDRLVRQTGISISPPTWLALCVLAGVAAGGICLFVTSSLIASSLFAVLGVMTPIVVANHLREKRQSLMLDQMPEVIDRLARLCQTGRNLASCFGNASIKIPAPLGPELNWIAAQLKGGASLDETLVEFASRTGLPATSMLTGVLRSHSIMGGDLSQPLFDLADTVRDQLVERERERAVQAEGQWPAAAVILLPFVTSLFFLANQSTVLPKVLNSVVGSVVLCGAAVAWCLGSIVVLRIVRQVSR